MKKLLTLVLCLVLAVSAFACSMTPTGTEASTNPSQDSEKDNSSGSDIDTSDITPLDPDQYLLEDGAFETDALKAMKAKDIMNGHDPSEFVKDKDSYTIGVSFQDLTNPVWAGIAKYIQDFGKEHNITFTIADCGGDASTQVSQIENYIQSGVDGIFIGGVDGEALEDVTARALDEGIPVMGIALTFGYGNCILVPPDYQAGEACATQAAEWINEKFDGKCQVAILNYPQEVSLLDRGNAIESKLKELCPDVEIVAVESAINTTEGYDATETILQAYPDVKVICTIGDGGAVGANEAVIAAGKNTDDFGIFGIDGTDEACVAISDPTQPYRSSISFGNSIGWARYCVDNFVKIFNGEDYNMFELMPVIPVNNDNLLEYCGYSGTDLSTLKLS